MKEELIHYIDGEIESLKKVQNARNRNHSILVLGKIEALMKMREKIIKLYNCQNGSDNE